MIVVSYGKPPDFNNKDIKHKCSTEHGSSGSPILLINNQKLIGIHCAGYKMKEYNKGTLIIYSIIKFQQKHNIIKDNKTKSNYIIAELEIKEDNETIRIINSYEEFKRENNKGDLEEEYLNEKEIKENCKIRINNEIIPFLYKHKFNKKGKYTIEYIFNDIFPFFIKFIFIRKWNYFIINSNFTIIFYFFLITIFFFYIPIFFSITFFI